MVDDVPNYPDDADHQYDDPDRTWWRENDRPMPEEGAGR